MEGTARCDSRTTPPTGSTGFPESATRIFDVPPLVIPGFAVRTPSLATGLATGELGFGFMSSALAIPAVDARSPHATVTTASSRLTRVRTGAAPTLLIWPPLDAWRVLSAVMGGLSNHVVTSRSSPRGCRSRDPPSGGFSPADQPEHGREPAILVSVVDEHPDADQVIELYDRHAEAWARDRGDRLIERTWLDRFVACLPAQRRTVLDVGCGTAVPISQYLIDQGCLLHGVDSSIEMITMTRKRFPDHRWDVADMRSLALNGRYGGIIAWDSLFHLSPRHQRSMFPVFARHAAPGAALMFNTGPSAGVQIGNYRGEPLYHASLDPAEYRTLLADNGFTPIAHAVEDPTCGRRTIWLARNT